MVATLEARRKKKEEAKDKENAKNTDIINEVNKRVSQNRGTTI
jgi:hypothetical protein